MTLTGHPIGAPGFFCGFAVVQPVNSRELLQIDLQQLAIDAPGEDVLAIDEALELLGQEYPDCADLIKLRFFGGLSLAEAAQSLGQAPRSADRNWAFARAWLYRELAS